MLACAALPASAAQVYIQPNFSVGAENDSNLDLEPGPHSDVQGYLVSAASYFDISTPSTDSVVKPRFSRYARAATADGSAGWESNFSKNAPAAELASSNCCRWLSKSRWASSE